MILASWLILRVLITRPATSPPSWEEQAEARQLHLERSVKQAALDWQRQNEESQRKGTDNKGRDKEGEKESKAEGGNEGEKGNEEEGELDVEDDEEVAGSSWGKRASAWKPLESNSCKFK